MMAALAGSGYSNSQALGFSAFLLLMQYPFRSVLDAHALNPTQGLNRLQVGEGLPHPERLWEMGHYDG
jgi:hypothetical protein